jgi:mannose-6-phosphate isomerase
MAKNELRIEVLGSSLTVSAEESLDYLQSLLGNYKKILQDTQKSTGLKDPLKIAILTGFLLCDELEKARQEKPKEDVQEHPDSREAEKLTMKLISRLDDILESAPSGAGILKLTNTIKKYSWGSSEWIPALLGRKNPSGEPWAELWMGVHPEGPSLLEGADGTLLSSLIAADPVYYLGAETGKKFGVLPFLFKVLAAGKPLSIQAHPNLEQAREGWERENQEGINPKSPDRNYKDPNHKPEIIFALSPFTAMCGFRRPEDIRTLIDLFSRNAPDPLYKSLGNLVSALTAMDGENPLKSFLRAVFSMDEETRQQLSVYAGTAKAEYPQYEKEWTLIAHFAGLYPSDPAVIAPLYLNLIELNPGEAVYLPAGVLHAYIRGLGVELMANSDNVLRGGLTPKHIDLKELFRVLKFSPFKPQVLKGPEESMYRFPAPCEEFSLSVLRGNMAYTETGPSIVIVTEGCLTVKSPVGETQVFKGESVFIPAGLARRGLNFSGNYTACSAGVNTSQNSL